MRLNHERKIDADREHKLLEEFRTAAFGHFCKTKVFLDVDSHSDKPQQVWLEGIAQPNGSWLIMHNTSSSTDDGKGEFIEADEVEEGLSFYDAIKTMAEFEQSQKLDGALVYEDDAESSSDLYFRTMAIREAIAFDANTEMPVPTMNGRITTSGVFTPQMRQDVLNAWNAKRTVFKLPEFDINRRLKNLDNGLSAEDLKKYLKTKDALPIYIELFEKFIDRYRAAAANGYGSYHDISDIEDIHTALEECIDEKFPEDSFPSKQDLKVNAAKMYVYFTLQQLQANYQSSRKSKNAASTFLEEKALPKLEKLTRYYRDRARASLPAASKLVQLVMDDDFTIEGTPPNDIIENYAVLKRWYDAIENGRGNLPDATLPATLPLAHYVPMEYDATSFKKDVETSQVAEQLIEVSKKLDQLLDTYTRWLATGATDDMLFEIMGGREDSDGDKIDGQHDELEKLIAKLPAKADFYDRDFMIDMSTRLWMQIEIYRLKAKESENDDEIKERLEMSINFHKSNMAMKSKERSQTSQFREDFKREATRTIKNASEKIPATMEPQYKEWQDDLQNFAAAYRSGGLKQASKPAPVPTP